MDLPYSLIYKSPSSVPAEPKGMTRYDFEFGCEMRLIWPLSYCVQKDSAPPCFHGPNAMHYENVDVVHKPTR
jgi:hypothetical protein